MLFPSLLVLAALLVAACGSASFDGRVYRSGETSFRVGAMPPDWQPVEVTGDDALALRDPKTNSLITVSARCGRDSDDVPLEALTKHLFIQFTERAVTSQAKVQLDGREALRTEMTAKLDGVMRRFCVYVLKKDGCVYDFLQITTEPAGAASDRIFDEMVRGFSTLQR